MSLCEICEEKGIEREGTKPSGWDTVMCEDCQDRASEAAWESFMEDYYGGGGPVTINEQYQAAAKERAELRRKD